MKLLLQILQSILRSKWFYAGAGFSAIAVFLIHLATLDKSKTSLWMLALAMAFYIPAALASPALILELRKKYIQPDSIPYGRFLWMLCKFGMKLGGLMLGIYVLILAIGAGIHLGLKIPLLSGIFHLFGMLGVILLMTILTFGGGACLVLKGNSYRSIRDAFPAAKVLPKEILQIIGMSFLPVIPMIGAAMLVSTIVRQNPEIIKLVLLGMQVTLMPYQIAISAGAMVFLAARLKEKAPELVAPACD